MKKKYLSIILTVALSVTTLFSTSMPVYAAFDGKIINENLNASVKPEHVTLTWTDDPMTTQTITWRTSTTVKSGVVQYLAVGDDELSFETAQANLQLFQNSTNNKDYISGSMNIFSVTLKNLAPGTKYIYRVGDSTNWSNVNSFITEASNVTDFKFMIFGDSQSGDQTSPNYSNWNKTVQSAYNSNKDAKFMVNVGDLVENGQDYIHWNNWFDAAKGVVDNIPEMAVQGNHETYYNGSDSVAPKNYVSQFKLPQNGPDSYKGQTYSYDYGNTHIVVLDSQEDEEGPIINDIDNSFLKKQATWLDTNLSNSNKEFKIVFFHKTPYYNKASRANVAVKDIFDPVMEKYHVDIVFNGHDHGLSRTYPIKNGIYSSSPKDGTVYYVVGRSGAKYYPDLSSKVWDAFFYDCSDMPVYETVQVTGNKLTVNAFKQDGTKLDTYVIDKDNDENSTKVTLPGKYNVDTDMKNTDNNNLGQDPRLVIYGTPITFGSNQAEVLKGVAYANPTLIASYLGGTYDSVGLKLTIGSASYTFSSEDLSAKKNISITALKKKGFNCEYNTQFNMVMVDK